MKSSWCIKFIVLVIVVSTTNAQQIGLSFGKDVVQHKFFPESPVEQNNLFYSYFTGENGENLYVVPTYYDYRFTDDFSVSVFFQDVLELSFLNYLEIGYSRSINDIVWAGDLVDENGNLLGGLGYIGFYQYQLNYISLYLGYNYQYFKKSKTAFYLSSNVLVQGKLLVSSQVDFSHRSFETGDPTGKAKEADARLTGFNIGLNTQHRIGYTIGKVFTPYVGVGLGIWVRSLSRSNEQHLAYLDTFEDDYGNLYKVRSGPFPVVNLHFGVLFTLENVKKKSRKK